MGLTSLGLGRGWGRPAGPRGCLTRPFPGPRPDPQIIANHHMQSISFASGGDPVSWETGWTGEEATLGSKQCLEGLGFWGSGARWAIKLS